MMVILAGITAPDKPLGFSYNQFDPISVMPSEELLKRLLNVDKEVDSECDQDKALHLAIRAAGGIAKDVDDQMIGSTIRSPAERKAIVEDRVKEIMLIPYLTPLRGPYKPIGVVMARYVTSLLDAQKTSNPGESGILSVSSRGETRDRTKWQVVDERWQLV